MRLHRSVVLLVVAAFAVVTPAPASAALPGDVLSVGADGFGQLGNGSTTSSSLTAVPVQVSGPVAVASGRDTAYALDVGGQVWAWGNNSKGSVGDGTVTHRQTPVPLGLADVVEVEAGHYHGLALTGSGQVWAWGFGRLGQIGDGGTSNRRKPTRVQGLPTIERVAAGRDSSYAVDGAGNVWAWGSDAYGEIGDGGGSTTQLTPVRIAGLTGVVEISVGRNHVSPAPRLAGCGHGATTSTGRSVTVP